ncbi:phytanoyl-CoA dioxygenase family protein [Psychromonas sp.]|nr:phytanoyl-CoA dioxygenase family protein [Psychromonas sp.]
MVLESRQWKQSYDEQGFFVINQYFTSTEMAALREVILRFHERWKEDNITFYQEEAFNSSLITGSQYLTTEDQINLFNFISSNKMMNIINSVISSMPAFMNTQLFFDPFNKQQANFWHRDCQYDYDIEDQKRIIQATQVVHLRVPIFDEPGMEIVPGSHKRWDNEEEYNIRQEENNRLSHEPLSTGQKIPLNAGDVFVFSADMIHRGLYGLDRLAFDILVFDATGDGAIYADYVDDDCLPDNMMLKAINNPTLFLNTIRLKNEA